MNMPKEGEWINRSFDSVEIITAYINYASDLIDRFNPKNFEYGTEASELIIKNSDAYNNYIIFTQAVYTELKSRYPDLIIFFSINLKLPNSNDMNNINSRIIDIMLHTDLVDISVYPYVFYDHADAGDSANLPTNWLTQVQPIVQDKLLAISEIDWVAQNLKYYYLTFINC